MASRRANATRSRPESISSSLPFHLPEYSRSDANRALAGSDFDLDVLGLSNRGRSFGMPQFLSYPSNRQSFPNLDYTVPFGNGIAPPEPEPQLLRTGFSESPPEFSVSVTPVEQDYSRFDELMPVADNWDQATYDQFLGMGGDTHLSNAFDMTNILDFMNPQQASQVPHECTGTAPKPLPFSYGSIEQPRAPLRHQDSSLSSQSTMDVDSSAHSAESDGSRGLLASQESWPFFSCNRVPKSGCFPPTTAAMYVEGLTRVLTTHPWQLARTTQHEDAQTTVAERLQDSKINNSIIGHSTETLDAAAQAILQKACTTHDSGPILINGKENQCTISLPPREAILRFIESYLNHHEHYYFACAADLRQADSPVLQSSVRASSLLMLLMVAQGAAFISIPAARYLASGLIEACRLFLFESIERDILLSREPTVLHSALLFTTAAAWSGDNWHMDIAMGQRGMYIAMMTHTGMLNAQERRLVIDDLLRNPARSWDEWKTSEEKRRIAYSWVIVDQELSLFSDTAPLLNIANLQSPMPSAERLWEARSADEWASRCKQGSNDGVPDDLSLRDLFTCFVEGDLGTISTKISALQLRLLLHPLQTLVCQLRQFLNCLPDSGRQSIGTSISKVAIKARLEEISTLLRQWYSLTEHHIDSDGNACCTTRANLIMYHLIFLNTMTSLGFIEQFARGEVQCQSARQASLWLKQNCIDDAEQIFFHCGQILRHIKSIPEDSRPPWWSGAVYRAALVGWATSMASVGNRAVPHGTSEMDKPFALDNLSPEHPSIEQYLKYTEGVPMLSKGDGTLVGVNVPNNILRHCISILEADLSMRATEGITKKLQNLLDRWSSPPFEAKV